MMVCKCISFQTFGDFLGSHAKFQGGWLMLGRKHKWAGIKAHRCDMNHEILGILVVAYEIFPVYLGVQYK